MTTLTFPHVVTIFFMAFVLMKKNKLVINIFINLLFGILVVSCFQPDSKEVPPDTSNIKKSTVPLSTFVYTTTSTTYSHLLSTAFSVSSTLPKSTTPPTSNTVQLKNSFSSQSLTWSPDTKKIAYIGFSQTQSKYESIPLSGFLAINNIYQEYLLEFKEINANINSGLTWSNDSSKVYFISDTQELVSYDLLSQEISILCNSVQQKNKVIAYTGNIISLSNNKLLYVRLEAPSKKWKGVHIMLCQFDLDMHEETCFQELFYRKSFEGKVPPNRFWLSMAINPDESQVSFTVSTQGLAIEEIMGLYIFDLRNLTLHQIEGYIGIGKAVWSPDGSYLVAISSLGDGTNLWFYEQTTKKVWSLSSDNWLFIKATVNPQNVPINVISLHNLRWIDSNYLTFSATTWVAGNDVLNGRITYPDFIYDVVQKKIVW